MTVESLELLEDTLTNSTSYFTGVPLKKYWKEQVFMHPQFYPKSVATGKWSAYGHTALDHTFTQFLSKFSTVDTIILDPLSTLTLPPEHTSARIQYLTYKSNSISLNTPSTSTLTQNTIAIITIKNGSFIQNEELLRFLQEKSIPTLLVFEHSPLISAWLHAFSWFEPKGIVVRINPHPLQTIVYRLLGIQDQLPPLFLSYISEKNILSTLEYKLSEGQNAAETAIAAFAQLLTDKVKLPVQKNLSRTFSRTYSGLYKKLRLQEPRKVLLDYLYRTPYALPDVIFSLLDYYEIATLPNQEEFLTTTYAKLHSSLTSEVAKRPAGTLLVPAYNTQEVLTSFVFFTTERGFWRERLEQQGFTVELLTSLSNESTAQFAHKFGVSVHLLS